MKRSDVVAVIALGSALGFVSVVAINVIGIDDLSWQAFAVAIAVGVVGALVFGVGRFLGARRNRAA